jgi:hypothetical protein
MFSDDFNKQLSPLQNNAIRKRLEDAILADDPRLFREILEGFSPEFARETRLYSVLVMGEDGMSSIMVDQTGQRLGPNDIITAGTPIDQLNADIVGNEIIVTIGDQQYRAFISEMADQDESEEE